jgi:hypothetical protein
LFVDFGPQAYYTAILWVIEIAKKGLTPQEPEHRRDAALLPKHDAQAAGRNENGKKRRGPDDSKIASLSKSLMLYRFGSERIRAAISRAFRSALR